MLNLVSFTRNELPLSLKNELLKFTTSEHGDCYFLIKLTNIKSDNSSVNKCWVSSFSADKTLLSQNEFLIKVDLTNNVLSFIQENLNKLKILNNNLNIELKIKLQNFLSKVITLNISKLNFKNFLIETNTSFLNPFGAFDELISKNTSKNTYNKLLIPSITNFNLVDPINILSVEFIKEWNIKKLPLIISVINGTFLIKDLSNLKLQFFQFLKDDQKLSFLRSFFNENNFVNTYKTLQELEAYEDLLLLIRNTQVNLGKHLKTHDYINILWLTNDKDLKLFLDEQFYNYVYDPEIIRVITKILKKGNELGNQRKVKNLLKSKLIFPSAYNNDYAIKIRDVELYDPTKKFKNKFDNIIQSSNLHFISNNIELFLESIATAFKEFNLNLEMSSLDKKMSNYCNIFTHFHSSKKVWNNEKISILMTSYNSENTIDYAIKSVIGQTLTNWELLICDDCSNDKSLEIIKKYASNDDRILYFRNKKNCGTYASKNMMFNELTGQYVVCFDSDDWMLPQFLEKNLNTFRTNKNIIGVMSQLLRFSSKNGFELFENYYRLNLSSFFYPAWYITLINYNTNRFGSDAKFIKDAEKLFPDKKILKITTPLSICDRTSENNLTKGKDIAVHYGGKKDLNRRLFSTQWKNEFI